MGMHDKYGYNQDMFEIAYDDFCYNWWCNNSTEEQPDGIKISGAPEISENGEWVIDCIFPDGERSYMYMDADGNIYVES